MKEVLANLQAVTADAQTSFGNLSAAQINWKPNAESWSVGQCLEHLIKTNELFFPEFDRIAAGARQNSFWENWSPLSGFLGGFLIKSLQSDEKKFKAPSPAIVPPSNIAADIVAQFARHQDAAAEKIRAMEKVDITKVKVTSPLMKLMTYTLSDALTIIIAHEQRHIRQAKRVMETEGFPR
jgi:uncharacterized damage-inducible protein DinB